MLALGLGVRFVTSTSSTQYVYNSTDLASFGHPIRICNPLGKLGAPNHVLSLDVLVLDAVALRWYNICPAAAPFLGHLRILNNAIMFQACLHGLRCALYLAFSHSSNRRGSCLLLLLWAGQKLLMLFFSRTSSLLIGYKEVLSKRKITYYLE